MKKLFALVLAMAMTFSLAACGGSESGSESVDLNAFYQTYQDMMVEAYGEDGVPYLTEMNDDILNSFYPGLTDVAVKQRVAAGLEMMQSVCEIVLVEVENAEDVETVQSILQTRIDDQKANAWYPMTQEAWENNAQVVTNGNFIMMLAMGDSIESYVEAFNGLFA